MVEAARQAIDERESARACYPAINASTAPVAHDAPRYKMRLLWRPYVDAHDLTFLNADMVLLSIGVRPTLQLSKETGLEMGEAGGLLVK